MTQFIDLKADFDISEKSPQHPKTKSRPITLIVSLVVHGLVLFLLFYFSGFTSKSVKEQQPDIASIKATLYFPPPAVVPIEQVETPTEQEIIEIPQPEEIPEPALETEPGPQTTEPKVVESIPIEEISPTETTSEITPAETPQQNSATRMQRLNQALSRHLNSLQEKQVTEMSQDASRNWQQDYYQRQTSGYRPPPGNQETEGDNLNEEYTENMMETGIEMSGAHQSMFKAKEVDCSNTASEVLTSLSGVFGGRIKCNDSPDFQKYIDARLKKK